MHRLTRAARTLTHLTLSSCLLMGVAAACDDDEETTTSDATDVFDTAEDTAEDAGGLPLLDTSITGQDTSGNTDVDQGTPTPGRDGLFSATVQQVQLEVDYQTGAAPFVAALGLNDPWDLFETNADAIFDGQKSLIVPRTLDEMQELTDVSGEDFDVDAILAIADTHWDDRGVAGRKVFYVLFLDGYFNDAEGRKDTVLGVSIGNTGVIAMFKPVIEGPVVERFVEQTTLVHEFGHAIGLVNNGIALVGDHHDEEHGAHCSNTDCVMYWLNEGAGDMVNFVQQYVATGDSVVWGQDCLDDAAAALSAGAP